MWIPAWLWSVGRLLQLRQPVWVRLKCLAEINSPVQLRRPRQQKPVLPGCCINSSTFKHQPAACLCGLFQFVYYTTFWKCSCLPFFFFFSWNYTPMRHCCQNNLGTNIYPTHFHCDGKPKNGPQLCASFLHDSALFSVLSLVSYASVSRRKLHREIRTTEKSVLWDLCCLSSKSMGKKWSGRKTLL